MAPALTSPPLEDTDVPDQLTSSQLREWQEDGYLIIPNALSPSTVQMLLRETHDMLSSFSVEDHPMTKFSTGEESSHIGDDYFLTSGDKVRFFFEEGAFSPSGKLTRPKKYAINKIGHYIHELSPAFKSATFSSLHRQIARAIGFNDPRVLQSMIICKQPEIGGAVPPHQDSTFLYTNPPSAVGFWIALEDATVDNGCLSFAKGSHKRAPVTTRFIRKPEGGTGFEDVKDGQWPHQIVPEPPHENETYGLGQVKAGTLILIHGNLLHKSEKNLSGKSRFIYTFHMIEADTDHHYDGRNWLQPPEDGFSRLYTT